jgi:hypothetical protein
MREVGVGGKITHRDVAGWLRRAAINMSRVRRAEYSYVWPPYENESGFVLTLDDGTEWEVLVSRREVQA